MLSLTELSEQVAWVRDTMDKVVRVNRNIICKSRGINGLIAVVERVLIFKHTFFILLREREA